MTYTDTGAAGTVAVTTGAGTSGLGPGTIWGTNWQCSWNLTINVTPGTGPTVSYDIEAEADDPISLGRDFFADNTAGRTSLYLPLMIRDLAHLASGRGGMSVAYATVGERVELLNLESSGSGVVATGDEPSFLRTYVIQDPNDNPMGRREQSYSLVALRDVLDAKMKNGILSSPLMLGLLLENVPVPTTDIAADGVVAEVHVAARLAEAAAERYNRQRQSHRR